MLPFTREELEEAVKVGDVTARYHPHLPYTIYNYSPEIQFTNKWTRVTRACRGLILDNGFNVIARPWEKFFNLGQVDLPIQFDDPVEVMDKADGSLGILYPVHHVDEWGNYWDTTWAVSTRGSFESEQAIHATKIWDEKYSNLLPEAQYTLLFEIIYPSNRIVLDYGDMDDLVLLGAVANETGYYISPVVAKNMFRDRNTKQYVVWPGPVVETYDFNSISKALGEMGRKGKEGFVIRSHNFMVKIKEPDYLEIHRLVTNASPKTVWEKLKEGKTKTQIVSLFPDEFHDYIAGMIDPQVLNFQKRYLEIQSGYEEVKRTFVQRFPTTNGDGRGMFARYIKDLPDKRYYFLLLDGKSIREVLWSELKPVVDR